ncbi:MAG: phosphoenolpyruvate synthase [Anaerolineaceae bacterium]
MQNLVLTFQDPSAIQLIYSGGKGANLSKMAQLNLPVPPGFIVTTNAYNLFMDILTEDNPLPPLLKKTYEEPKNIAAISMQIRDLLENAPIPGIVINRVRLLLASFPPQQCFAIRSSATAEDLPFLSFAGQQDTFLNIQGLDNVLEHIRKCWASLFTERAITYRIENHIQHSDVQMAVVVQSMVFPQVSGILFTADPISNNHQMMTINASYGLGEAIVSGLVNPDLIEVNKADHNIIRYTVAEKKLMIEAIPGGGTQKKNIPEELAKIASLTENQVSQLSELGLLVENHYKQPQDLEWAIENGEIFLLQTRPITSLFPIPEPKPNDENLHIYFSFGHAQMNTNPISPLGISLLQLLLPFGRPSFKMVYSTYLLSAGGRLFADITAILNNRIGRKIFPKLITFAEPVSAKQISHLLLKSDFDKRNQKPSRKIHFSTVTEWLLPLILRVLRTLYLDHLETIPQKMIKRIQNGLDQYQEEIRKTPFPAKISKIEELSARFFRDKVVINAPLIGAGFVSIKMIEENLKNKTQKELLKKIQRGLEGNITTEMDLVIADLAYTLTKSPDLVETLERVVDGQLAWNPSFLQPFPDFESKWLEFMQKFGMRAPGEIDIAIPRWQDQPQSLLQMLLSFQDEQNSNSHREHFIKLREESQNAQEEILQSLRSTWPDRIKIPLIRRLLKVFSITAPLREHPKYMIICFMNEIRQELVVLAQQMVQNQELDSTEDIWFIRLNELHTHFQTQPLALKQIVKERRMVYHHFDRLKPPRVITSDGEIPSIQLSDVNFPPNALAGSPVSSGIIEGLAHVILDPRTDRLMPGEILVAPFTDPGWTPLFVNAIGLVLETGGLMTHGSVVAREYGIPAVVGIVDGTRILKTGMRIRVNGNLGYVEILETESK